VDRGRGGPGRRASDLGPAYVIAVTGSASYSGVVMGVLMLTGALGPALGRLTDRCRAHRVVLVLGNFGLALACVAYDLSSERDAILGLSIGFIPDQDRWSTDTRLPASQLCAQPRRSDATAAFGQAQATMTAAAASLPRLRPTNPQRITLPTMFTTS
jgi:hypothetical protein